MIIRPGQVYITKDHKLLVIKIFEDSVDLELVCRCKHSYRSIIKMHKSFLENYTLLESKIIKVI